MVDAGSGDDRVELGSLANDFLGTSSNYRIRLGEGSDLISFYEAYARPSSVNIVIADFETGYDGDRVEFDPFFNGQLLGWDPFANPFSSQHLRLVQVGADAILQVDWDGSTESRYGFVDFIRFRGTLAEDFLQNNLGGFPADGTEAIGRTIVRTSGADVLRGDGGPDILQGLDGDDEIVGCDPTWIIPDRIFL